jgi:hypothetical protein
MQEEGRLIKGMSGDNTDGSTNIVPMMGIDNLTEGYKRILNEIYSPKQFYERVKTFLSVYKLPDTPAHLELEEFKAFFRSVWQLGIIGKERTEYWKLFFWTLFRYPRKFAMAITFSIYGYHFRQVSELNGLSAA